MRARVARVRVVQVVRGHERQPELFREPDQVAHDATLDAEPVIHDLDEVVVPPEDVAELRRGLDGLLVLTEAEAGLHLAARAPRRGDDSRAVPTEKVAIHARLEVVALDRGER